MICKICENENRCSNYICYRCINTSVNLLLPWRFKLIEIKQVRDELSKKVNIVLEEGLDGFNNDERHSLLNVQLKRVQMIKEVRRNNKIKQNISNMELQLDKKREEIKRLKQLLERKQDSPKIKDTNVNVKEYINDTRGKLKIINKFVLRQQIKKLNELNKWFCVRVNVNDFSLFNQPVVSLTMLKDSNNETMINSLGYCLKYIEIVTKIYYIYIPYSFIDNTENNNVWYGMSLLIYCCFIICDKLKLFPCDNNNIKTMLREYELKEILYCISKRGMLTEKVRNSQDSYNNNNWTIPMIQEYIEEYKNSSKHINNIRMSSTRDTVLLSSPMDTMSHYTNTRMTHEQSSEKQRVLRRKVQGTNPNNEAPLSTQGNTAKPDNSFNTTINTTNITTTQNIPTNTHPPQDRWFVVG